MLRVKLSTIGIFSDQSAAYADRTIVTTALKESEDLTKKVVIVAEDTDVAVLLTALCPADREIFLRKPARANKPEAVYSSRSLSHMPVVEDNILLLHAITGCNTVSGTYYQGKTNFFKTFQNFPDLGDHAAKFKKAGLSSEIIFENGAQLILAMYSAPMLFRKPNIPDKLKWDQLLQTYRCEMYRRTAATGRVNLANILPTVDAIQQHLKRVYFQVQQWLHGYQLTMDPTKWGWRKEGHKLVPVQMEEKPAPKNIMELICCVFKGDCNLNTCRCRKHGLPCNIACKICSTCLNTERYSDENVTVPETEASDEGDIPRMNTSVDKNDQTHLSY
ncbi:unnamed protein product [Psylliodes chrysocephalus]|uniref:Tesmin/TSO1-like CXC domain-containing protein n=1 Tax=Psylliodes chrysocephalus TaxID=3402493 RepID=A0A9P0CRD9_9CUCU|nr:unnamed protein product [Psylliodes chrysocephala]